ncbi:MAG: amino acid adenylation domain-containing protein [Plectolyngbya sp. WJT66-NPBG17]|jgi:amino acid adenylation domain-containing protein|nr:amino acid adenylation domain-containing protein [Plectolyngbya sp. WJT66-NPBG17]
MTSAKANQISSSQSPSVPVTPFITTEITVTDRTTPNRPESSEIEAAYPLSPMQQGMLFHHRYEPRSGVDIEQVVCTLREAVKIERFVEVWQQVVDRHAILRTCIGWDSQNEPIQQVRSSIDVKLKTRDWQSLTPAQQSEQLNEFLIHDRQRNFDLSDSLMRFALIQIAPDVYEFVWSFHHILLDGRSITRILQEVFALYDDPFAQLLPARPYQDYIEQLQQQDWSRSKSYWQQLLKGFTTPTPLLTVPTLQPVEKRSGHQTAELQFSAQFTQTLRSFTEQHNITPNTLVQAAWALLLHRYSSEETVVFGATRACRKSLLNGESIAGLMMNTLPVRVDLSAETTLLSWLQELRSQHLTIRPYENTPLSQVQAWSEMPRGTALFESIVVFEHQSLSDRIHTKQNRSFDLIEQPSFPLVLIGSLGTGLTLKLSYDRQRFEAATIDRMLGHLHVLLSGMIADPNQRLSEIPLLTATERHQLLFDWNATEANYQQHLCLHQLFEAQVERTPNAIATVYHGQSLTYAEVNQQANQIAHHLRSLGVRAGEFVGVFLDRGLEMIPALLGILKAGGAYIPLETSFPKARIEWILDSLSVRWVMTQAHHVPTFEAIELPQLEHLLCLDVAQFENSSQHKVWTQSNLQQCSIENLPLHNTSEDTAYVIFTSGSTGTPKGVVVKHRPVINLIEWVNRTFNVNQCDRVLFITSLCFDLSVYDIFGLLAAGGSIQIASSDDVRDPQVLIDLLQSEPITFWDSAPPALQQLSPLFSTLLDRPSSLRLVFLSGDWIPVTLPIALQETFPGLQVISLGGATEATVWSNFYPIDRVEPHWTSIPYGKPIQNAQYYVLDPQFKPCPIGVTGELYIAGDCLASGYTDPVKTEERFLPNPFSSDPDARLYRAGDLARFFEDGNIEFLGRIDHQVKIRGYRIELGEIEAVLSQHQAVQDSIVMAREDQPGEKRLVAYVVKKADLDVATLRQHLREKLPEYMVPSAIAFLDTIPLTQNGKVDRRALPAPEATQIVSSDVIELTQNPLERQLMFIWERVLEVQPIATTDNFFDLGGNSLTAVKLINQVEKAFGQELSIASLFQAPTIEQFAEILRDGRPVDPWAIIEITPLNGKKPPLFWCQNYGDMIPHLEPDQPFFALESGYQQVKNPETHIKDWAQGYVDRIRQIQPEAPYLIGGYCFGGYVALEIAQILRSQGQEVALLALVETFGSEVPYYQRNQWTLRNAIIQLASLRRRMLSIFESRQHKLEDQKIAKQKGGRVVKVVLPPDKPIQQAVQSYTPQPYFGKVVLFEAELSSLKSVLSPKAFWGKIFQGDFTIESVKGTHQTVVFHQNGRDLVKRIQAVVDRVISP